MEIIKEKTIAFTGNRNLTSPNSKSLTELKATLHNQLTELLEKEYTQNGISTFISGMALGWDMLCATAVIELKRKHPEIRLIAVLPFIEQADDFPPSEQAKYRQILDNADQTIVIGNYDKPNQSYHKRNDYLIANATKIIAYHNGKARSGTGSTIRKAIEKGLEVVNLY